MFCLCANLVLSKLRGLALSVSLSLLFVYIRSLVNARGYYEEFDQEVLCDGSSVGRQEQTDAREVPEVGGCKVQYAQERKGEGRGGERRGREGRGGEGKEGKGWEGKGGEGEERGGEGKGGEGRGGEGGEGKGVERRGEEWRVDMDDINCIEWYMVYVYMCTRLSQAATANLLWILTRCHNLEQWFLQS